MLTLALGLGAATAAYAVVRGVLLRDLPYAEPDRLVLIWRSTAEEPQQRGAVSPRDLLDLRESTPSLSHVAGINSFTTSYITEEGGARQLALGVVTGDYFGATGVPALFGRTLSPDDDRLLDTRDPESVSVVVLSHTFWSNVLGGDRSVLGRVLRFGGSRMRVVGVMPESFAVHMPVGSDMSTDLAGWTPLGIDASTADRDGAYLKVWARLAPGASLAVAQSQLEHVSTLLREMHRPHEDAGIRFRAEPLQREVIAHARGVLLLLALTAVVTLIVACANVATLLLVQFMGRLQELTVRAALGASRARIARQLTMEAAVLSVLGASCGIALAAVIVPLLLRLDPGMIPKSWAIRLDGSVFAFAALFALLATTMAGTIPALLMARAPLEHIVRSRTGVAHRSRHFRTAAVIAQVAGALLLIFGSVTLAQTVDRWRSADHGFDPEGVHTFSLTLPFADYRGPGSWVGFYSQLLDRLEEMPGVSVAAVGSDLPMDGYVTTEPWLPTEIAATASWGERMALHRSISPAYFAAAGIRVIEGRALTGFDAADAALAAVVDSALAWQLTRERSGSVIGRRIDVTRHTFNGGYSVVRESAEIVGVVATVPHDHPEAPPPGTIYLPHAQYPLWSMNVLLRGPDGRVPGADLARDAVAKMDASLPLHKPRSLQDVIDAQLAPARFLLALITVLTVIVGVLSASGLFGVVAESVRQGRRDLAIRFALGAQRLHALRAVVAGGAVLIAAGVVVGAALSPFVGGVVADTIVTGTRWNRGALLIAAALVIGVGLVSCYLPARRVARISPLEILRAD